MSQRSLFECGVSKSKADESDLADNAVCAYIGLFWSASAADKETKTFVCDTREDGSKMFGSTSLTGLNTTPSQCACSAAKSKNIFSNEGAGVYIFVVLIAHFPRFVRLKNKKTRKDLMQTWKFKTKKNKNIKNKYRKKKKNWRKASNSLMKIETRKTINSYKFLFLILLKT